MRTSTAVQTRSLSHVEIRKLLATRLPTILRGRLPYRLHDYQKEDILKFIAWLKRTDTGARCYYPWATGLGKTVEFCTMIAAAYGLKILVIESGKQLVGQTSREAIKFTDDPIAHASSITKLELDDETIVPKWNEKMDNNILVTTDESFKAKAKKILKSFDPDLIIWDEGHWGYTDKAQKALGLFKRSVIVQFTATPDYLGTVCKSGYIGVTLDNGQVLYGDPNRMARTHFGDMISERTLRWGIQNKYLAPLAWGRIEFPISLDGIKIVNTEGGLDYEPEALHRLLAKNWGLVVKTVVKLYKSGQYDLAKRHVAAICPGIAEAEELTAAIKKLGIRAECITNKTKDHERDEILAAANRGEVKFLASVFALREGWDCKLFEVALMLRPTRSRVLYIQFMGRVLRVLMDKVALVVDPFFTHTKFAPLSAPILFGTPGETVYDGDILVRPRGRGRKKRSPYLVELINKSTPKLVIEHPEIEYWADKDGFFEADGERWGNLSGLGKFLKISRSALRSRIPLFRSREGKDYTGCLGTFYALSDVEKTCSHLLKKRTADQGTFKDKGIIWISLGAFRRKTGINQRTVEGRIDLNKVKKQEGLSTRGRKATLYPLAALNKACADLLDARKTAGKDGTFKTKNVVWISVGAYWRRTGIGEAVINKRISSSRVRSCKGKNSSGRPLPFYALADLNKACATDLHKRKKSSAK